MNVSVYNFQKFRRVWPLNKPYSVHY